MRKATRLLLAPLTALLVVLTLVGAPAAAAEPYCGITWGSLAKAVGRDPVVEPITNVRAGRHACYDRLVVDLAGPLEAYNVRYVRSVRNIPGDRIPLKGGAVLQIDVWAPTYDASTTPYTPVYQPEKPARIVPVRSYRTFRQVRYVGSFEGISTFGLGVRARLPFRVFRLDGPGDGSRLVIDVAHRWSASAGTPAACADPTRAAAIYYAADVPDFGPRLYREWAKVPTCAGPITESVTRMLQAPPVDADYTSLWKPSTRVRSVSVSGDTATVDLTEFPNLGAVFEGAAVQQLVWTVTAANTSVSKVRILVNGQVPDSGHYNWSDPIRRANSLQTLSHVWILTPTQGAAVNSPVQVSVYGTGYEGNVPIKVFQGNTEVTSTHLTTQARGFSEASTKITLPAGHYTIKAYNGSGRDPGLTLWDTKDFTVR